jgi:soluble lytic murein transglycosylase
VQLLAASSISLVLGLALSQVHPPYNSPIPARGPLRVIPVSAFVQSADDNTLASVRRSDHSSRGADGRLIRLTPAEHLRRANVYMANRAFDEAREQWQTLINYYPQDAGVPEALLGIGRSYFQSRRYDEAYSAFDRLARNYGFTKEGREGLNFSAAALLRWGKVAEAADRYVEYIVRFPNGERIDTAHLNTIDSLREAGKTQDAIAWVTRTRDRFAGTPIETNALFARLRLDVSEGNWKHAVSTAEEITRRGFPKGVLTTPGEIAYLKAYSLDRAGNREAAFRAYLAIPDGINSYYGWLATERLLAVVDASRQPLISERVAQVNSQITLAQDLYPIPYRQTIVKTAKARKLDPRFILALIRQESVFRPLAKSPSGARGLLQLTIDTAQKYAPGAGLNALRESELYRPETSILVGGEYLAQLAAMFPNMLEAVAASYNGGEDNVARWVTRAKEKAAGVFTSEIGFDETKAYVQKVMSNYRAYRQLYTADLVRR